MNGYLAATRPAGAGLPGRAFTPRRSAPALCSVTNYWGLALGHEWPEQRKRAIHGHLVTSGEQGVYAPVRSTPALKGRDCPRYRVKLRQGRDCHAP